MSFLKSEKYIAEISTRHATHTTHRPTVRMFSIAHFLDLVPISGTQKPYKYVQYLSIAVILVTIKKGLKLLAVRQRQFSHSLMHCS